MITDRRGIEAKSGRPGRGPVVYWMSRDQRADDNWALLAAQERALKLKRPLVVLFCLVPSFLGATLRQYAFMVRGLVETQCALDRKNMPLVVVRGEPGETVPAFLSQVDAAELVADFDPLRIKRRWQHRVADEISIPFSIVDAHNIVPCLTASDKAAYGAYTLRPKIRRLLPSFLEPFPPLRRHAFPFAAAGTEPIDAERLLAAMPLDRGVPEATQFIPGLSAARRALSAFVKRRLAQYDTDRNDPLAPGQSGLSPYLHFGQLSAQRAALTARDAGCSAAATDAFLEELVVRRELSDNFCCYNENYDSAAGFPEWAQKTLDAHRGDTRPYIYTRPQFEQARTHDALWNAAQREMVATGKMHGYLRMYWAKKILEWSASPDDAMATAIYLNDRYELDGRDPNGYAGIAWSIGGVHDRAWGGRPVFGSIRYMSYNGCRSKFDVAGYIRRHGGTALS